MKLRETLLRCTERYIAEHGIMKLSRDAGIPPISIRRFIRGEGNLSLPSIQILMDLYGLELRFKTGKKG